MSTFPKTIIELYDDEEIYNVLAATEFKPQNVVFIGAGKLRSKKTRNNISACFDALSLRVNCIFNYADMLNLESVMGVLRSTVKKFPDCAIDITGGCETALVAVGMLAKEMNIPLFRYDGRNRCYKPIWGCSWCDDIPSSPSFNLDAILALSGSVMKSHGHLALNTVDSETEKDIFRVWGIYKSNHRAWHRSVAYLQQISKDLEGNNLHVNAAAVVYNGTKISGADSEVMRLLSESGIILNYKNDGKRISFDYKNKLMRSCLIDIGICLELYVFAVAHSMDTYSDIQISAVIDWDGILNAKVNTINEIDVVLVRGFVPIFISCKSGTVNVTTLNEIKTLAVQFGGKYARPVLVTMSDIRTRDKFLYQRAADMGVTIIDRTDLVNERLSKRLYGLSNI